MGRETELPEQFAMLLLGFVNCGCTLIEGYDVRPMRWYIPMG